VKADVLAEDPQFQRRNFLQCHKRLAVEGLGNPSAGMFAKWLNRDMERILRWGPVAPERATPPRVPYLQWVR
jgi:hypothetical protein